MTKIKERAENLALGCMIGLTIGDALGSAVNNLSAEEISALIPGGITGFVHDTQKYELIIRHRFQNNPIGTITANTQLAHISLKSLIAYRQFNLLGQINKLIEAYAENNPDNCMGWDRATIRSVVELKAWLDGNPAGRPMNMPARHDSSNVPAIRIVPFAIYQSLLRGTNYSFDFLHATKQLCFITHGNNLSWIASVCVAKIINKSFLCEKDDAENSDSCTQGIEQSNSTKINANNDSEKIARCLICTVRHLEDMTSINHQFSDRLHQAVEARFDPINLRKLIGTSSDSLESVPFAIATFLRHPTDFKSAVLEAVNAGGNTSAITALVGAMVGANVGINQIPTDWINAIPCTKLIKNDIKELVKITSSKTFFSDWT